MKHQISGSQMMTPPVTHHRMINRAKMIFPAHSIKLEISGFVFFTQCLQKISHIEEDTEHCIERSGKPQVQSRVIQNHILCGAEQCNQISSEGKENDYRCNTQQTSMIQAVRIPLRIGLCFRHHGSGETKVDMEAPMVLTGIRQKEFNFLAVDGRRYTLRQDR